MSKPVPTPADRPKPNGARTQQADASAPCVARSPGGREHQALLALVRLLARQAALEDARSTVRAPTSDLGFLG